MNRIDQRFAELKERGETAMIPFLTIGDPSLQASLELILEMERSGADLIELGVPYSDPLADGPVIQRSSERALQSRITIFDVIDVARQARSRGSKLPFILFTYYNPVLQIGLERIFRTMQENEISGIIIPDLPLEEDSETRAIAESFGIHLIPLVAPTSNERVQRIASEARGFVYCVSSLGVTGERSEFFGGIENFLSTVREAAHVPIVVGFGISNREQVQRFEKLCDGVVVGSAIVRSIESALHHFEEDAAHPAGLQQIGSFVGQLKGK
ncbi:tryptophan synthase subunit alpha [Paenibacillus sp. GCM10023248]|uniref:tryptophan synthase subunit alpha n=1 Tax=Bacillales TaxID=1385 RepID=UPI002377D4C8|nr:MULTISPECIES: tryptophan synthase subunit alpha [Bacillales]MDD9267652.1 tryptophan synthase subunit alpha [Paenibacillus sp. MAHUQ-63]MDR6884464.1 tryptophan synthase alpha chain [Bacillus sp. 3255]